MRIRFLVLIALTVFASVSFSSEDKHRYCDELASFASETAQERTNGVEFSDLLKRIDQIEASYQMKMLFKGIASDVYKNGFSPEEAYSDLILSCMRAVDQK